MPNLFRNAKARITSWTLGLTGVFLILAGSPMAGYSIDTFHPYFVIGASMIILGVGFIIVLSAFANQKISLRQTQITIGLCGQALLGIVAFEITLTPLIPLPLIPAFTTSPFNLQTYSIVLGTLGITITIASIIMIGRLETKQTPS